MHESDAQMRGDLTATTRRLVERRGQDFERIVLETTGIADPAPIVHALMAEPFLASTVRLDSVIVTVDAMTAGTTLDTQLMSRRQVALADVLIVTKTDLLPEADDSAIAARLRGINPHAAVHTALHGRIDPAVLVGGRWESDPLSAAGQIAHEDRPGRDHDDIGSISIRLAAPIHAVTLTLLLQTLAEVCGRDLLRLKGLVEVYENPGRPALVHGVQHVFHPIRWLDAWPGSNEESRLVLIGRKLETTASTRVSSSGRAAKRRRSGHGKDSTR